MTPDSQLQFQNLLAALHEDRRLSEFHGIHFNGDGSLMTIDRWGGHQHPDLSDLVEWLRAGSPDRLSAIGDRRSASEVQNAA